jgi:glycosyltransferase involved in cell wall biosynthesis
MVIGIDGNEANIKTRVGVGQFSYQLLKELHRQNKNRHFLIFLKNPPLADMPKTNQYWRYLVFGPKPLWTKIALPLQLTITNEKIDYFLSLSHYSPNPSSVPTIPTIHDIGYLRQPAGFTKKDIYQLKNWTASSIKHAHHILAVSEFTKNEVIKTFHIRPENISVIRNGVGKIPKINKEKEKQVLNKFNITPPYFLAVGTLKPNKNYPFLIKAFASSHLKCSLVIAGKKGWLYDEIFELVNKLNLSNQIIFTDFISEAEKWALYRQAAATVIPSLYEGFGIPALESQRVGTPVIASHITPLMEVLQDSALYINPTKIFSLVSAFKKITHLKTHRKYRLLGIKNSRQFTWVKSAQKLLDLFDHLSGV